MSPVAAPDSIARVDVALRRLGARLGEQWRVGQRLPPVRELAQELEVSHPTAYRAVQQLVRHGFLVSRARLGVYVSDQFTDARLRSIFGDQTRSAPAEKAKPLAGMRVSIALPRDSTHMYPALEAVAAGLATLGATVAHGDYGEMLRNGLTLEPPDADAVIVINPDVTITIPSMGSRHLVIVTSAAGLPVLETPVYDLVSVEQEHGSRLAGEYLKALGCTSACFVGVHRGETALEFTSYLRLHGFERGFGQRVNPAHMVLAEFYSAMMVARLAKNYAEMNPRPQGVFAASDDLAVGFINGLAAIGLEVDRDYHMVSFDGQRRLEQARPGGVCSVIVPAAEMGRQAVELLVSRINHPTQPLRKVLLGCTLNRALPTATSAHTSRTGGTGI